MPDLKKTLTAAVVAGVTAAVANPATSATMSDRPAITNAVMNEVTAVVAHATNGEPWYKSRVTWGAILSGVAGLLAVAGKADLLPPELQGKIIDGVIAAAPLISFGVVLYGRYVAKKPIGA